MDFFMDAVFNEKANRWEVSLAGEVDIFSSPDMKAKLNALLQDRQADLHIDCGKLEYLDSTALGSLVGVLKNIKAYGGEMHLSHIRPNLLKLFRITNLDKVFVIEGDDHD